MKKIYFSVVTLLISLTTIAQNDITFNVDMSSYGGSFTTVYLSGEMNGWNGTSNPMTDMGSGIWSTTVNLADGEYQYKFQVDDWADQENFTGGDACTVTDGGFVNRILEVNGAAMTLDTPTFSVCYDDGNAGPHDTTFNVDMSGYGGAFTTLYISGQFNGWDGTSNPMTDMGGGMWSVTLPLAEAYTEFKFQVDGWADQENFMDGDAGTVSNGGFTNRYINVLGQQSRDYTWNTAGSTLGTEEFTATSFKAYPNPTNDAWNIVTDNVAIKTIQVYDVSGRQVLTMSPKTSQTSIDGTRLQRGIYFATINTDKGTNSIKLVKN
ncbi:glycogen branching enzyme [Kordia sp. SMS9]|uniref:T9SS type A sorting domain-containing protein n=1 Tax=Kordia sp. SMS9 TaxID=2282170 RepID=UPI000E0CE785|nr:T9SS type A sorting domain-containing protein [Kordia sp. SMS9]AXG71400.1 glycogen branching enzyme [Kordia sp. SMS9]